MTDEPMTSGRGGQMDEEPETGSSAPSVAERSLEKALGLQIRTLRRQQDLSVADLASAAGISNGMLSKIENGGISPSLTTLQAISGVLQVPLSSLFASFEERQDCSFVPAGQGLTIDRRGTKVGHVYRLLGHVLRGDVAVEPYLIELSEDAAPYTSFRHSGVEFIHMLKGEMTYRHGSKSYALKGGDSLLFDSAAAHGPEELSGKEIAYLSIIIYPRSEL
ncbi:MAG: helix-turn-helix transcriptional regulator [Novosphingobium sp.]|nr:helix-turn-helix transcriptional regulator [Novosphingobium sp.]MCP5403242.1 helix-turn-helix transcriptional regulator [Novosphingobium sp.]